MSGAHDGRRVFSDAAALAPLAGAWDVLADAHGTLAMQGFAWCDGAARTLAPPGTSRIVVDGDERELRAVAPLVAHRGHLELLGVRELFEPMDLLAASPEALAALCGRIARLGVPLRLERIPQGSPTPEALRVAYGRRGRVLVRESSAWPSLVLGDAWAQELGGGLSSRRRSDLRRALRKAETEGEVVARLLRPTVAELPPLLEEAFAIEDRGWKGEAGSALARDPSRAVFYRDLAERAAAAGRLRIDLLDIGGRPAAMQIALDWDRRLWLLKIGYDLAFRHCSPGMLLLAHSVRAAAEEGLEAFELLGTAEGWVEPWTTDVRPTVTVLAYPADPRAVPGTARDAATLARRRGAKTALRAAKETRRVAVRVAERRYLAGPELADAVHLEAAYRADGLRTTVGYWNADDDSREVVAGEYGAQVDALAGIDGAQISIKAPAVGDDRGLIADLFARATAAGVGVHLDSLAPESQPAALDIACGLAGAAGSIGCTLPGRWPRSLADAARIAAAGIKVRVVKSEWPSPEDPGRDPRQGFLEVVRALADAGAPHVAVATHDGPLAQQGLAVLVAAGVPCELQVLHGMQARAAMAHARAAGVPIRVYVPYGHGRLPYSLERAALDPQVAARLARDLVRRNRRV